MRYLLLVFICILCISGCTFEGGYQPAYYAAPVPVYYSGSPYAYPYHYYHSQIIITPHYRKYRRR